MHYVPYNELRGTPHIIVDSAATVGTVLTLSHWPKSGTPHALRADLSAQIAFHYLDQPELGVNTEVVSNTHFDEDGLVSLYALTNPAEAHAHRAFLIDVAAAGDFATYRWRDAARAAFVLAAFADPQLSPLDASIFREPYPQFAACLYKELLAMTPLPWTRSYPQVSCDS